MPYHILSTPCLRIIEDKNSGLTSLMDIVESAKVDANEKKPFFPPFKLYTKWGKNSPYGQAESFQIQLTMMKNGSTQKKTAILDKFELTISEKSSRTALVIDLERIEVPEDGAWFMLVNFKETPKGKWKEAARLPLLLKRVEVTPG